MPQDLNKSKKSFELKIIINFACLQFEVSDADSGNSGRVDFRIATVTNVMKDGVSLSVSQSSVSNLFRLSGSGELISTRALNKEEVDSYTVVITAVDRGKLILF